MLHLEDNFLENKSAFKGRLQGGTNFWKLTVFSIIFYADFK